MLNRQRTLLYLLKKAGGAATRIKLTKWSFLLKHETSSRGGPAFYDFVPYKYGPYSFCLQHEIAELAKKGIIDETDGTTWRIGYAFNGEIPRLSNVEDAALIMLRYDAMTTSDLMETVYSRYPWFTINSHRRIERTDKRPRADIGIYTIGYEGLSVDRFLNSLLHSGICCVADVRNSQISRRYGFHQKTLSRLCDKLGIRYCSFRELGIPSESRRDLQALRDYQMLFRKYREEVLENGSASLSKLGKLILEAPTALLCMEADSRLCHRSILAEHMGESLNLRIVHLGGTSSERRF